MKRVFLILTCFALACALLGGAVAEGVDLTLEQGDAIEALDLSADGLDGLTEPSSEPVVAAAEAQPNAADGFDIDGA